MIVTMLVQDYIVTVIPSIANYNYITMGLYKISIKNIFTMDP